MIRRRSFEDLSPTFPLYPGTEGLPSYFTKAEADGYSLRLSKELRADVFKLNLD